MQTEIITVFLAFLEGFALIISPCILPILPLVLSGSLTGNKKRPLGIIVGFIVTFSLFTLFSRLIINFLHIDPLTLRYLSFFTLSLFGLIMISNFLSEKFAAFTSGFANVTPTFSSNNETGFFSGIVFGSLIGLIWTPCAGPILAAVIVQVITLHTTASSLLVVIAFAIGAGLPMLLIALLGRQCLAYLGFFRNHSELLRKLLGFIILGSVIYLAFFPTVSTTVTTPSNTQKHFSGSLKNGLLMPYLAPALSGLTDWINSPALTLADLHNKVVLIDFWTYSCINCLRTLPYLKDWYAKYHDKGLEIIGVHAPEFQFEHDINNVRKAVADLAITYPVALDNDYETWRNYQNQYWPAHYLIDKNGFVVYEQFGEGDYDVTENNIRFLLGLDAANIASTTLENGYSQQTPEIYLGYARGLAENSNYPVKDEAANYDSANPPEIDHWSLQGSWTVKAEKILAASANAQINLHFYAGKVYAVMGSLTGLPITVKIEQNNQVLQTISVTNSKLYSLASFANPTEGQITLIALQSGLEVYTFTFGD